MAFDGGSQPRHVEQMAHPAMPSTEERVSQDDKCQVRDGAGPVKGRYVHPIKLFLRQILDLGDSSKAALDPTGEYKQELA